LREGGLYSIDIMIQFNGCTKQLSTERTLAVRVPSGHPRIEVTGEYAGSPPLALVEPLVLVVGSEE